MALAFGAQAGARLFYPRLLGGGQPLPPPVAQHLGEADVARQGIRGRAWHGVVPGASSG